MVIMSLYNTIHSHGLYSIDILGEAASMKNVGGGGGPIKVVASNISLKMLLRYPRPSFFASAARRSEHEVWLLLLLAWFHCPEVLTADDTCTILIHQPYKQHIGDVSKTEKDGEKERE